VRLCPIDSEPVARGRETAAWWSKGICSGPTKWFDRIYNDPTGQESFRGPSGLNRMGVTHLDRSIRRDPLVDRIWVTNVFARTRPDGTRVLPCGSGTHMAVTH
jgi:hypothetical protein